jgi:DUF917 family protein
MPAPDDEVAQYAVITMGGLEALIQAGLEGSELARQELTKIAQRVQAIGEEMKRNAEHGLI